MKKSMIAGIKRIIEAEIPTNMRIEKPRYKKVRKRLLSKKATMFPLCVCVCGCECVRGGINQSTRDSE